MSVCKKFENPPNAYLCACMKSTVGWSGHDCIHFTSYKLQYFSTMKTASCWTQMQDSDTLDRTSQGIDVANAAASHGSPRARKRHPSDCHRHQPTRVKRNRQAITGNTNGALSIWPKISAENQMVQKNVRKIFSEFVEKPQGHSSFSGGNGPPEFSVPFESHVSNLALLLWASRALSVPLDMQNCRNL